MPIFEIVFSRPLPIALRTADLGLVAVDRATVSSTSTPSSTAAPTVSNISYGLIAAAP